MSNEDLQEGHISILPRVFNSLSGKKETIETIDKNHLKMYVCGPTVYERPHLGNARSVIVYDLFYRLFKKIYPKVTYVRNITDLDDKINESAKNKKISIQKLTTEILGHFHADIKLLNVLPPDIEPKATEHIGEAIKMISLLVENGHAYESAGHILFDVSSYKKYGHLSNRNLDEMINGVRIEVAAYKRDPLDFVLWKPMDDEDDASIIFNSPFGKGRPGWHIECSAMSTKYLGDNFDVHGGGADLQFPHHENEIAQSCGANKNSYFAKYWIHNGFLTVNGEKMSKSLKNFVTVHDALQQGIPAISLRYLLLSTHYRKPLDYNKKSLDDALKAVEKFYLALDQEAILKYQNGTKKVPKEILHSLSDDLNTSKVFAFMHKLVNDIKVSASEKKLDLQQDLLASIDFIGIFDADFLIKKNNIKDIVTLDDEDYIISRIELRKKAKLDKNWQLADEIRQELLGKDIALEDNSSLGTTWKKLN